MDEGRGRVNMRGRERPGKVVRRIVVVESMVVGCLGKSDGLILMRFDR